MPRAIRDIISVLWLIRTGVLVECDPSIKAIIVKIDSSSHAYIVEELDDQTLVIKENMLGQLKRQLDEILKETQVAIESDDEK
ncbi:BgTH12-06651 [Blumeria graminis f. sp. triticale]|uniref:General transcription and DNA repair factor IIH subunit TFB5 n=1 Tax=Blumeria graminis f. sp. triticale TaxID=1689686 RepID=A0A9W4CY13_BLUGR|nr:BgTH12-06651 [Blumeria graminis f. sp. triticale]